MTERHRNQATHDLADRHAADCGGHCLGVPVMSAQHAHSIMWLVYIAMVVAAAWLVEREERAR